MLKLLKKYKYQILLILGTVLLFWLNYKPGTNLIGWDSLQTELNPGLAVKRAFFSVWEEYQSLGLTAGMAHATDLVRAVFLWLVSFVVPQNAVRYFYHFLMIGVGGIGAFTLLESLGITGVAGFLGAIFYMLNLGTVQIFYLPFESFSTFFAFLPFGIWSYIKILKTDSVSNSFPQVLDRLSIHRRVSAPARTLISRHLFLVFLIVNFLGTPSFYTQQLFVVYLLILGCVTLGLLLKKWNLHTVKKSILALILILIINSFWILPQVYFLKVNGSWVTQAKANQMATEETFYQNLAKGNIGNFLRLEGFYFDLKGAHNTYLFAPWRDHFSGITGILPYFFALMMLVGLYKSLREKKYGFILIFLLCALALLPATFPFSTLNMWLRNNNFINQIFRSPFTKFIVSYSLVYAYFVAEGIKTMVKKRNSLVYWLIGLLIIVYSLPTFQGYFISPEMKVTIPQDYLQTINYFKTVDKNQRIALLPDYTFWGWFFTGWNYNGSGFMWYGIEQPIISRTFDVWSPNSESYFWEEKQALEAENLPAFEKILDKYDVNYLIVDESLVPVVSNYKSLNTDRIENLIGQSQEISLVFKGQNLALYKVNHSEKISHFITVGSNLKNIGPAIRLSPGDVAYLENNIYKTDVQNAFDFYYPYLDLTTQTDLPGKNWTISEDGQYFYVTSKLNINPDDYSFYLPASYQADIFDGKNNASVSFQLEYKIDGNLLTVRFPKALVKSYNSTSNQDDFSFDNINLSQRFGYLAKTETKNVSGAPYFFYVSDDTKNQSIIEDKLRKNSQYFIVPEHYTYGLGYSFHFQSQSYANYPADNQFSSLSLYVFPYEALKQASFVNKNYGNQSVVSRNFQSKKINYFTYQVLLNNPSQLDSLILYQSYDPGWIAFANGKILNHIKINNWANGWTLDDQTNAVTIIFWPQYLEFTGFILLAGLFLRILFTKEKHE